MKGLKGIRGILYLVSWQKILERNAGETRERVHLGHMERSKRGCMYWRKQYYGRKNSARAFEDTTYIYIT